MGPTPRPGRQRGVTGWAGRGPRGGRQVEAGASGAELVAGRYRCERGGADTLLVHGDELCQNDLPYQRAKRWLRHPLTRWVARRLPVALAAASASLASRI